jgi:hypothetical protein
MPISWNYEYIIFGQIIFQNCHQFKAFVGLSDCRTIGPSDYRTVGLSDCRTIGLSDYSYGPIIYEWIWFSCWGNIWHFEWARLVIRTSRTVGSAKKFMRITSSFAGGEFTKTLHKVCTCQKLKFAFLLLDYCKIRECYAVANAFTIRNMHSLLLYMKCNSRTINRPTKNMTKIVTLLHFQVVLDKDAS